MTTRFLFPAADPAATLASALKDMVETFDWSKTPLGPIRTWSDSLRTIARTVLSSPVPMCLIVGREGILIYNDGYAKIAGGRHPDILGMPATAAWPEIADFNQQVIDRVFAGECLRFADQRMLLNRNGIAEEVWLDLTYSPVPGDDGKPMAALALLWETTDRFRAKRELQRTSEKLSFTLAASSAVGAWDWDLVKNVVTSDARFAEMFGVDPEIGLRGAPIERYVEGVHPDDRDLLQSRISLAIETGEELRAEYRLLGSDGVVRWVLAHGRVVRDASGQPVRLPGVVVDITDRKVSEEALAASEAGFRALADSMPQMVWSTQPDGFHDYYNARWYEFTGVPTGSTDGEGWNAIFHQDDRERAFTTWRHSLDTGQPYQIEYRLRHHSGQYRWTLGRALPVRDAAGNITRWFGTCTDIHETKLVAEEREIVAQELSHRIKNIFSVLTGIISLSARAYPEVKPFADQLRQRVYAMGKAHDFVRPHSAASQPTANQSSLRALIVQLLAAHHLEGNARVSFVGSDAEIDDGAATPLALLFHELATNAAKYGALSTSTGRVVISGRADEENYHMTWQESGVDDIDGKPKTTGFGSRLISLSVEGQLGGKLEQYWEKGGLRVELTLPRRALNRSAKLRKRAG